MDNDAKLYYRFLDGDDNGLAELIDIYNEGLSLYINSIINNTRYVSEKSLPLTPILFVDSKYKTTPKTLKVDCIKASIISYIFFTIIHLDTFSKELFSKKNPSYLLS